MSEEEQPEAERREIYVSELDEFINDVFGFDEEGNPKMWGKYDPFMEGKTERRHIRVDNGMLTIREWDSPDFGYRYAKIIVNENDKFEITIGIQGQDYFNVFESDSDSLKKAVEMVKDKWNIML